MKPVRAGWARAAASGRGGQIMVLAVAMVLVLAAVCALTIDVGLVFYVRAQLQNGADAASLAAVLELMQQRNDGASEEEARAEAEVEAEAIAQANVPGAGVEVKFGLVDEDGQFIEQDTCVEASAVKVGVWRDGTAQAGSVELFFAPLLGLAKQDVRAEAVARSSSNIRGINNGLRPFAVYENDVPAAGEVMTIYDDGQVAPGCFGLLDFNGGSHGVPELRDWILNGYDDTFGIDPEQGYTIVSATPGLKVALKTELNAIVGQQIVVCVYDEVTGQGANAEFRVVSFLCITLVEVKLTGQEKYVKARVEYMTSIHDADVGDVDESRNVCRIRLVM